MIEPGATIPSFNWGDSMLKYLIAGALLGAAVPAMAEDTNPCAAGMVCASEPATVVKAFQAAGYKAKLAIDSAGDPLIESAASGYDFDAYFYGCVETKRCDSLQFRVVFIKEPENTTELANKWNVKKRFLQMAVQDDGRLTASWDVSTVNGLSGKTFEDVLANWEMMLGELSDFFRVNIPAKKS